MGKGMKMFGGIALLVLVAVPLVLCGTCSVVTLIASSGAVWMIAIPVGVLAFGFAWYSGKKALSILREQSRSKDGG